MPTEISRSAVLDESQKFLIIPQSLIDSGLVGILGETKALAVYLTLKRYANFSIASPTCFPSIATIAKLSRCSKQTVHAALRLLQKLNLVKVETTTYSGLRERGLLPARYPSTNVKINLYTLLDPRQSSFFENEVIKEKRVKPSVAKVAEVEKPKKSEAKKIAEKIKGEIIGAWTKAKRSLLGAEAKTTIAEIKQLRDNTYPEFYGLYTLEKLKQEIAAFWVPAQRQTEMEKECCKLGRTVGAFNWLLRRKSERQASVAVPMQTDKDKRDAALLASKIAHQEKYYKALLEFTESHFLDFDFEEKRTRFIKDLAAARAPSDNARSKYLRTQLVKSLQTRTELTLAEYLKKLKSVDIQRWARFFIKGLSEKQQAEIVRGQTFAFDAVVQACKILNKELSDEQKSA